MNGTNEIMALRRPAFRNRGMGSASPAKIAWVPFGRFAVVASLILLALAMAAPAKAADYENKVQSFNPLGYWKLDETASANDAAANSGSIGASLNGSYGGYASRAPVAGALDQDSDQAQAFNGSTNFVRIPFSAQLNPAQGQSWSAEIWAKTNTLAGGAQPPFSSGTPGNVANRQGWVLYFINNNNALNDLSFRAYTNNGANTTINGIFGLTIPNIVTANVWHHVVVTCDGTDFRIYFDGALAGTTPTAGPNGTYSAGTTGTALGLRLGATTNEPGLPNPPNTGMGATNKAASFDGSGNVNCGSNAAFNLPAFSVSAWVKSSGFTNYMNIMAKGGTLWRLNCNDSANTLSWVLPGGGLNGTKPVADGNWHHIVATADASGSALYVDGVLDATGGGYNGSFNGDSVWIGSQDNFGALQWIGTIDEAALFPSKLTAQNVADLYAARITVVPDAPLYWAPAAGGGGSGIWSSASNVWAGTAGIQGAFAQGTSGALVFGDAAGTVTINGTVSPLLGLKFSTTGYSVVPGVSNPSLNLAGTSPTDNTITVDPGVTTAISAALAGTAGFNKEGTGTLILSAVNPITGNTGLSAGTLQLNEGNTLQNATVTVNGGSLVFDSSVVGNTFKFGGLAGSGAFALVNSAASPVALTVGGNNASTIHTGAISGAGSLAKVGLGALTLGGSSNFSGGTTVQSGTIKPRNKNCFGSGQVSLAGGVVFNQDGGAGFEGNTAAGAYPNPFFLSGGPVTFNVAFGGATDIWTNTQISGPGSIVAIGDGRAQGLTLEGANNFSGGVTLGVPNSTDGVNVSIFNVNSLGTGPLRSELKGTDLSKGGLRISADLSAGVANPIELAAGARLVVNTSPSGYSNKSVLFTGPVTGAGRLVKIGDGTMALSGTNTYTGNTIVNGGTFVLEQTGSLKFAVTDSSSNRIEGNSTVTFNGSFVLDTTAVTNTAGTWNLVAVSTLNETFGPSFNVPAFTQTGAGIWVLEVAGGTWTFTTFDGNLTLTPISEYTVWALAKGLGGPESAGEDFDGDGRVNFEEFALDGDPLTGASDGKVNARLATLADSNTVFTLTLPVRAGAVFNGPGDLVSDTVDGVIFRIQGSADLTDFITMDITEITGNDATAIQAGLPALAPGWTYRTFRTPGTVADSEPRDFLRVVVAQP